MNATTALGKSLLNGDVLSVMNCFKLFGLTNAARELSRCIEKPFNLRLDKRTKPFKSRYGQDGYYFEYRLLHNDLNRDGIEKLKAYISQQEGVTFTYSVRKGPKSQPKKDPPNFTQDSLFGGLE